MPSDDRPNLRPIVRTLLLIVIAALLASSLFCFAISMLPAADLKARLDGMAPGGSARDFPIARVLQIQWKALAGAGISIVLAIVIWFRRWSIDAGCRLTAAAFRRASEWARRELRDIAPALAIITAIGAVLRFSFLDQPVRTDEATTYLEFISKPLLVGLSYYPAPNNHIFHTVLAHFATLLFGGEPWAFRLVAFLAGILMIPAAAAAAIALGGKDAALPAAGLVAVSWPWVLYSANARGYTLIGLIFLILIPICARLRQAKDTGVWIWFVFLAALGMFTVPVMIYALVPLAVWMIFSRPGAWRELLIATAWTLALVLLLYSPALTASGFAGFITPEMAQPRGPHVLSEIGHFGRVMWSEWNRDLPRWVWIFFLCAAALAWRSGALAAIAATWFFTALLIYAVMPYTRLWLWLSLPWLLLVASGLRAIAPRRLLGQLLVIVLVACQAWRIMASGSVIRSGETGSFLSAGEAARILTPYWNPGDGLVTDGQLSPLLYEFQRHGIKVNRRPSGRVWAISRTPPAGAGEPVARLGERGIWLLNVPNRAR